MLSMAATSKSTRAQSARHPSQNGGADEDRRDVPNAGNRHYPGVIRDFAMTAEDLGYEHIMLEDHILGADPTTGSYREDGWHWGPMTRPGVTKDIEIHEPFVLMGFFAAATRRIGLGTVVLVLPQRQTALVAKQATEVDLLSNGRLRLGVGAGWNPVEFEALGIDFESRGQREEEQVALLRQLGLTTWSTSKGAGIGWIMPASTRYLAGRYPSG